MTLENNKVWGPSAWNFLHTTTFSYPDVPSVEEQSGMEKLFDSLKYTLPCLECKNHFINEIARNPPDIRSKTTLTRWLVDLHNRINTRLGKPIFSYNDALKKYSNICTQCNRSKTVLQNIHKKEVSTFSNVLLSTLFLCISVITILYLMRKNK